MDHGTLLNYPYVVMRLACRFCTRAGAYRLARLAVKFGPEARTDEVVLRLAADCPHWKANKRWPEGCGVFLPDLEAPRQLPDDPGARVMRVIEGGKQSPAKRSSGEPRGGDERA
jgi:hypothetical protein